MASRIVLASSRCHDYDFFGPISSMLWQKVVGFKATVLLIDTPEEWNSPASQVVVNAHREVGSDLHWIGKLDGYFDGNCAQSSRQHAAALPFDPEEWLMTCDIDNWPLTRDWYHQHEDAGRDVALYYANAYQHLYYCTTHVAAKAKTWREIMQLDMSLGVGENLKRSFDRYLGVGADTGFAWNYDELYFGACLKGWDGYPGRCFMLDRRGAPPDDRIDRSCWPGYPDVRGKVDAHLLRPGAQHENWERIRPILEQLVPHNLPWIDAYLKAYRVARYRV